MGLCLRAIKEELYRPGKSRELSYRAKHRGRSGSRDDLVERGASRLINQRLGRRILGSGLGTVSPRIDRSAKMIPVVVVVVVVAVDASIVRRLITKKGRIFNHGMRAIAGNIESAIERTKAVNSSKARLRDVEEACQPLPD